MSQYHHHWWQRHRWHRPEFYVYGMQWPVAGPLNTPTASAGPAAPHGSPHVRLPEHAPQSCAPHAPSPGAAVWCLE